MNTTDNYDPSLPPDACERIRARYSNGAKLQCDYLANDTLAGRRFFDMNGHIEAEYGMRDDKRHGASYRFYESGGLLCREPYTNGALHGTAYQWAEDGRLLGTYTLDHGTGIDLWWEDGIGGTFALAEVHYMREGQAHGFEWWLNSVGRTLWRERHWRHGIRHGIEREWNHEGRLGRTFPRFWVSGRRVTRERYLRAAADDSFLPAFQRSDNASQRKFPAKTVPFIGTHTPGECETYSAGPS